MDDLDLTGRIPPQLLYVHTQHYALGQEAFCPLPFLAKRLPGYYCRYLNETPANQQDNNPRQLQTSNIIFLRYGFRKTPWEPQRAEQTLKRVLA